MKKLVFISILVILLPKDGFSEDTLLVSRVVQRVSNTLGVKVTWSYYNDLGSPNGYAKHSERDDVDGEIHLGRNLVEYCSKDSSLLYFLIAHEIAHCLQFTTGSSWFYEDKTKELQADIIAGAVLKQLSVKINKNQVYSMIKIISDPNRAIGSHGVQAQRQVAFFYSYNSISAKDVENLFYLSAGIAEDIAKQF